MPRKIVKKVEKVVEPVVKKAVEVKKPKAVKGPVVKTILVGQTLVTGIVNGDTLMTAEGVGFAYLPGMDV